MKATAQDAPKDGFLPVSIIIFGALSIAALAVDYFASDYDEILQNETAYYNKMVDMYKEVWQLKEHNPYAAQRQTGVSLKDTLNKHLPAELKSARIDQPAVSSSHKSWKESRLTIEYYNDRNTISKAVIFEFLKNLFLSSPDIKVKFLNLDFSKDEVSRFKIDLSQFQKIE